MIKPDWKIFEAKFSQNPENIFEWFCYLLFCREFCKETGIFRYRNQSAIETDPIQVGEEIIGWQAKFYGASLTKTTCKTDVINALDKAKRDYPSITKFIFYTNQEWGQNKGKEPQGKKEVEKKADSLSITFEWRTASYFDSPFVSVDNEIISKHFFSSDKGIFDLINIQQKHSENILNAIHSVITFNNQNIKIDLSSDLDNIKDSKEQVLILSGAGGVGKTAIIKDYYEELGGCVPFCIFKATEFEINNINELFTGYSFNDFINWQKNEDHKIIVIDSAEKLLDLKNLDPCKEFFSTVITENWKVIFTTRNNYLEDLNFQFLEIYKIRPLNINIRNLEISDLNRFSEQYHFSLPNDVKLIELIKNPFYLSEYLKYYKEGEQIGYKDFKDKLWRQIILKSKPAREECFLRLALQRAAEGQFFINSECGSEEIYNELKKDEILGYESPHGYFITHDIYEEWALEKNIEIEFLKKTSNESFFNNMVSCLPVRRAFRKWISEQLLLENNDVKTFITESVCNNEIEDFWKDEVLVSVLLSDYSAIFFDFFKDNLLSAHPKIDESDATSDIVESEVVDNEYEKSLLHRMFFLLRLACKEVNSDLFKKLGIKNLNIFTFKYIFTKPKGRGWESIIKFVFENFDIIGVQNMRFVLPIIHAWTSTVTEGDTTKYSGLIALKYYQWIIKEDISLHDGDAKKKLLQTILYSSSEIKLELEEIFKKIIENKWKKNRDPYCDLSKMILKKFEYANVVKIFPKYVLQLADLFWSRAPKEDHYYHGSGMGTDEYFNIEDNIYFRYFPPSPYQTPTYWLLRASLREAIDFILYFVNKAVYYFAHTEFARDEIEDVEVFIEKGETIRQYSSNKVRLWTMYRGTSAPAPYVLQSMHMALEKFFLEVGKATDSKTLESWLMYLLKKSKSTSISAVVTSIVLAYPDKTFNVAGILFRTKEFFLYDTMRLVLDQNHKSSLSFLGNISGIDSGNKIYEEERLKACDDKHRTLSLENLFLSYQLGREDVDEEEFERRQKILWAILDDYYENLPDPSKETESDKTWRLYLGRMDARKMKPTVEKKDDGYLINFNPQIDPTLKEYSEKTLQKSSEPLKYISLKLWSNYRLKNDEEYKKYKQYEVNPKRALKEVKDILAKFQTLNKTNQDAGVEEFYLFNQSIPVTVCSVMIKDFSDKLTKKEKNFCSDMILGAAYAPCSPNYHYQVDDGVQSAISVLPVLFERNSDKRNEIKEVLMLHLFNNYPVDIAGTPFNVFAIAAIQKLWSSFFEDMQSILVGLLFFKPIFDALREKVRQENYSKNIFSVPYNDVISRFFKENEANLIKFLNNELPIDSVDDIEKIDLHTLKTAFQLIPLSTDHKGHKTIAKKIISVFAEIIISNDREDRIDYNLKHDFLQKLAYFILSLPKKDIPEYLKPFIDNFNNSETIAELFERFISAEDSLNSYENFWKVWYLFKDKIFEICKSGDRYGYADRIVKSYLFAQSPWKESAVEWRTFKEKNKKFFKEISEELGHCPSALYAISKLLNDIGSLYCNDGVFWISNMLKNNGKLLQTKLEVNTIYYLENLARKYIYENREKIKKTAKLKQNILIILDFLVNKGSCIGYMLRESIL